MRQNKIKLWFTRIRFTKFRQEHGLLKEIEKPTKSCLILITIKKLIKPVRYKKTRVSERGVFGTCALFYDGMSIHDWINKQTEQSFNVHIISTYTYCLLCHETKTGVYSSLGMTHVPYCMCNEVKWTRCFIQTHRTIA